ncbi:uncharacterized protein [Euphorbia lathyris]|uniref:uncharacterized protein isoform X3 n=1 Tax=Euphorbia lathyris TaxID=212925 RepID=UPI0033133AD5
MLKIKKRCTWDNNRYNSNQVYNAFIKRIRKRYSDFFSEMRSKNVQPKFLSDDVWKAWTTAWNSPEYKRKCMQNKINRRKGDISQPAQATHTGGSISHSEILERLLRTKLLGRVPTAHELFAFTHTKRHDGTSWSDPRAQLVAEEYVRAVALSAQSERDRAIDLLKTYYDVVGGHSKK